MVTKKEKLLKKYLDKKRKQRSRDDLYAQIVALNKDREETVEPVKRNRRVRERVNGEPACEEAVAGSEVDEVDVLLDDTTEYEMAEAGAECVSADEMMERYLWDVHVRNIESGTGGEEEDRVLSEGKEHLVEACGEQSQECEGSGAELEAKEAAHVEMEERELREYETRTFENRKEEMETYRRGLPIYYEKGDIIHAARRASILFIRGATGSGKTTQIPQFLYEGGFGVDGVIGMTQPRRLSAVSVSNRINEETNERLCGYKIKYECTVTPETKIKVMTDGVLVREIQEDFLLSRYSVIIVDEVHERSTNIDLLISIIPRIMKLRKERGHELKLILMSATGELDELKAFLGDMEVFACPDHSHSVSVFYEERTDPDYLTAAYERIKKIVLSEATEPGKRRKSHDKWGSRAVSICNDRHAAILVFLTSKQEIYQLKDRLDGSELDLTVLPLHSSLSRHEQDLIFDRAGGRKVILSTNIAETSVTIPDVVFVIDSGKVKNRVVDAQGVVRYSTDFITKSSAIQRTGRAGRTGPGICYRLYSGEAYEMFREDTEPQILRVSLDDVVLSLLSLGIQNISSFPFLSRPGPKAVNDAVVHLQSLGAIDKTLRLTAMGKAMSRYPIEPRLARILCLHGSEDIFPEIAAVVSLMASNIEVKKTQCNKGYFWGSKSDLQVQLRMYNDFLRSRNKRDFCSKISLNGNSMTEATKMASHLLRIANFRPKSSTLDVSPETLDRIRKIVYCGFVDHLAVPSSNSHFFRGEEVSPSSDSISIEDDDFVVFESLVSGGNRLYMRNITVVDRTWF